MTDKHREILHAYLYIVGGFLMGLGMGIYICTSSFWQTFFDVTQFPQPYRVMIWMTLFLLGQIITGYLWRIKFAVERSNKPGRRNDVSQSNT